MLTALDRMIPRIPPNEQIEPIADPKTFLSIDSHIIELITTILTFRFFLR